MAQSFCSRTSARLPIRTPAAGHDLDQLHADARNALAMALHYMRQPDANVRGAARKKVEALAALRRLDGAQGGAA